MDERSVIADQLREGVARTAIGAELGRPRCTISRESGRPVRPYRRTPDRGPRRTQRTPRANPRLGHPCRTPGYTPARQLEAVLQRPWNPPRVGVRASTAPYATNDLLPPLHRQPGPRRCSAAMAAYLQPPPPPHRGSEAISRVNNSAGHCS
ncbi:hypothetical protein [Paractinoplanes lichenicola]|uniref:Helix-turn-helix domain-containing protein n=1 Tax=Paractinoplanes lichenicola TaxID=2802976 RepID=A0ABS1VKJ1_9ACTN|nr:helix-turn-helix domain-containing protein [Actinoplanes lichenicola]